MTLDPFDLTVPGGRSVRVYRAACDAEYQHWRRTRTFEIAANTVEGKWFALSREDAIQWGRWMTRKLAVANDKIIAAQMPEELYDQFDPKLDRLDGIGPAVYAPIELLRGKVFDEVME